MKKSNSRHIALVIILGLTVAVAPIFTKDAFAQGEVSVYIGKSTMFAKKAHSHDISPDALKSGQGEYTVSVSADETYRIQLSEKQIEDILAGSTVVVETEGGKKKVKIGPKKKKAASSGW